MTNEEPVPTTSTILSTAEKCITLTNGTFRKKRAILDIDALWRKKLKAQEKNGKAPITIPKPEEEIKKEVKKEEEKEEESNNMEAPIDNIVVVKKRNAPVTFQLATLENENMELLRTSTSTEAPSHSPPRASSQYDFTLSEYPTSVTPATYTLYAPDSTNYGYYQYTSTNMQASPQETGYMVPHQPIQAQAPQSPLSGEEFDVASIGHTTRASPATYRWLLENYETAENSSLPRCTLYEHYKKHCIELRLDPINAASFGKLIRSVFNGLKTRRLGTRGNSKYHYYGIRIKAESLLNRSGSGSMMHHHVAYNCSPGDPYSDTVNSVASVPYSGPLSSKRSKTHSSSSSEDRESSASPMNEMKPVPHHHHHQAQLQSAQHHQLVHPEPSPQMQSQSPTVIICQSTQQHHQQGQTQSKPQLSPQDIDVVSQSQVEQIQEKQSQSSNQSNPPQPTVHTDIYSSFVSLDDRENLGKLEMPQLSFINNVNLEIELRKIGLAIDHVEKFINSYNFMCKEVLGQVKMLEFESIEDCWVKFWHGNEYTITKDELLLLCTLEQIQDYMIELDLVLYQTIVDCLIPNVLMSQLSPALTQSCRTFAKNIDVYLRKALQSSGISDELMKKKLQAIKYMQQGLKRYTSLNHLAQAARAVLQKPEQVQQMYTDYARVDMNQVHDQSGWICGCDTLMVQHVNAAFKHNLQKMVNMSDWADWLEGIVDQVLAKYHDKPASVIANVGKQFLLNWSFYTSAIIRDLTLRSAISFGSFHLIRLLADDYMYYLIESKIAKAGKQQIITVIRNEKDHPLFRGESHEYILPSQNDCLRIASEELLLSDRKDLISM